MTLYWILLRGRRRGGYCRVRDWSGVQGLREQRAAHAGRTSTDPHEPVGIAPLRLALDDEGLAADGELIAGARVGDLARPHLEGRGLGMDAGLAEADDRVRTPARSAPRGASQVQPPSSSSSVVPRRPAEPRRRGVKLRGCRTSFCALDGLYHRTASPCFIPPSRTSVRHVKKLSARCSSALLRAQLAPSTS